MSKETLFLLEARHIVKVFGALKANDDVNLQLKRGEIHALLGENGAGKSTLVKMIYGALQPTSGEFRWLGTPVQIASPAAARKLGNWHGIPAFLAVRGLDRCREHCVGHARLI